jgi:hypothetical protein
MNKNNNKRPFDETLGLPEDDELQGLRNRGNIKAYISTPQANANLDMRNAVNANLVSPNPLRPNCVVSSSDAIDMTMDITANHMRMMVRDCVKKELFRRLKFYKKEFHGNYDFRQGSVCALIIQCCNLEHENATLKWWNTMQRVIVRTHTDHRNNVIKTIHVRFRGK